MENKCVNLNIIFKSISVKLLIAIFLTSGFIAAMFIYNNALSRRMLLEQIEGTHENMLDTYVAQMDNALENTMSYILNLCFNEADPQILAYGNDKASIQYATVRTQNSMSKSILTNLYMDGFFLYTPSEYNPDLFISVANSRYTAVPCDLLKNHVLKSIQENTPVLQWNLTKLNNEPCLFALATTDNRLYTGAYVNLSHLLYNFVSDNVPESELSIIPESELDQYLKSLPSGMQAAYSPSAYAGLLMTEAYPTASVEASLPVMQKYMVPISVMIVCLVFFLILIIRRTVTKPLMQLALAMQHIQKGNLDYRLPENHSSAEFEFVYSTFNHMAGQIKDLKIDVYEERIKVQNTQLRNLQMQIKPHFLINSLNMAHNLLATDQQPVADRLLICTINYFRYMMNVDKDLLPLNEEIDHVKSYLDIQTIRYGQNFSYSIDIDPMIEDVLIPPIIVQTFVENSIKYALNFKDMLFIRIEITSFEKEYFPYALIRLSDNGPGYPENELADLNKGKKIIRNHEHHIGISNSIGRLRILFGENFSYKLYNDNGAVCEYTFPATFSPDEEDEME